MQYLFCFPRKLFHYVFLILPSWVYYPRAVVVTVLLYAFFSISALIFLKAVNDKHSRDLKTRTTSACSEMCVNTQNKQKNSTFPQLLNRQSQATELPFSAEPLKLLYRI